MLFLKKRQLKDCHVGDVCMLDYGKNNSQGDVRRVGTMIEKRNVKVHPISPTQKALHKIDRSCWLISLAERNGNVRRFYAEDVANRSRRLTWLARVCLSAVGIKFPKLESGNQQMTEGRQLSWEYGFLKQGSK